MGKRWVIGIAFLGGFLICIGIGGWIANLSYRDFQRREATEGATYARAVISTVTRTWDPGVLKSQMTPALLAATSPDQLKAFLDRAQGTLGPAVAVGRTQAIKIKTVIPLRSSRRIYIRTVTPCQFLKGSGKVFVAVVHSDGRWQVDEFLVSSPQLRSSS